MPNAGDMPNANVIRPGAVWLDERRMPIQAHGGGIIQVGRMWYWFGEDRSGDFNSPQRDVACYASSDLVHWIYHGQALSRTSPDGKPWVLERPKVYYNRATKKFVMYMHFDSPNYATARVGVAVSDQVDGPYQFLRSFRPLGLESRDIGQFVDDDGSAYLIFESRPTHGFYIAQLSTDYLDVAKETCFIKQPLEGGALVHYRGLYYVVGSQMSGWSPNPNKYATAKSLAGPWSAFREIAPKSKNTYGSQSSMLLKVVGAKTTTVIFLADQWRPNNLSDSRYLWMPVQIGDGAFQVPRPIPWTIDVGTGETSMNP